MLALSAFHDLFFRGVYKVPNHPGFGSRDCMRLKPLGVLVHGIGLYLNLVPFFVGDSANLNATVLQLVLSQVVDARVAAGKSRTLPRRLHVQLDGASTNWCRPMFGFSAKLITESVLEEVAYERNPIGKYPIVVYLRCHVLTQAPQVGLTTSLMDYLAFYEKTWFLKRGMTCRRSSGSSEQL